MLTSLLRPILATTQFYVLILCSAVVHCCEIDMARIGCRPPQCLLPNRLYTILIKTWVQLGFCVVFLGRGGRGGGYGPKKNYKGQRRHFTDAEELKQQQERDKKQQDWRVMRLHPRGRYLYEVTEQSIKLFLNVIKITKAMNSVDFRDNREQKAMKKKRLRNQRNQKPRPRVMVPRGNCPHQTRTLKRTVKMRYRVLSLLYMY